MAALGIRLSKNLTAEIEASGFLPQNLNGNPAAIAEMELYLYDTLFRSLQLANCSGAYFIIDATANTEIPGAENSKCGLYIKIANLSVREPVDMKILQYRGSTQVGNRHRLEYHNKWALEYNSNLFPNYELLERCADKNLNTCFIYSDAHNLPGTWENVILLSVPIVGEDGSFYGICGFEVSTIFYKLHHALSGAEPRMAGLLAPYAQNMQNGRSEKIILADSGLQNGNRTNYYADLSGTISVKKEKYFDIFTLSDGRQFAGVYKSLALSPLSDDFSLSVMIPKADYDAQRSAESRENMILLLLLVLTAVSGCIIISRMYVSPILSSFDSIQKGNIDKTNIKEIDNFLDYISNLMEERKIAEQKTEQELASSATENLEKTSFEKLNYQELRIADLTLRGYSYTEIAGVLKIKPNTVKWYQKELYSKLGINSKRELFALAAKGRK